MSNFKFTVNEKYKDFQKFLENIKNYFKESKNFIHKARNEIKIINYQNVDIVVKSFKIPNILNRVIYTFFRNSKAKKSYEYSLIIKEFTPNPIGFIEFYSNYLIRDSYFISEKFDYDFTIREPLLKKDFERKNEIFKAFSKFTFDLHEKGIYHLDYSPGNILIKKFEDKFIFKIVDINRMKFLDMDIDLRMKNFSKLWAKDEDLEIIIKEYSKFISLDEKELIRKALKFSHSLKRMKNFKKKLRGQKIVD
ncbi:hypothetical protein [Aliarcobacter butzleri]|uniref:Protein kinase domain-containing protein n=1 Tax=Aliarcobacter butzleri L352 TaxID=1447260 RepID=A0A837JEJ8_9BACT|nr:hypothetical protein [Aliarcobacter butzleri]KLE07046.1 hypothetical protein AF77_00115 [Aliarcobacter butzleri L352]